MSTFFNVTLTVLCSFQEPLSFSLFLLQTRKLAGPRLASLNLLQRSFRQKKKYRIVSPILLPYKLSISIYKNANKNISMYAWNKSICLSPWLYSNMTNMIPMIFSNTSWKSMKLLWGNIAFQKQFAFYRKRPNIRIVQFYNDFIPNFLHHDINALIDFTQTASQT